MTEYATSVANLPHDYNTQRYVGWMDNLNCDCTQGAGGNLYNYLFHQKTVNYISKKVSDHLWPLMNRAIVAPDEQIRGMITSVWNAEAGADNAGIYTQDTFNLPRNSFNRIILEIEEQQRIISILISMFSALVKIKWIKI